MSDFAVSDYDRSMDTEERIRAASSFLLQAPPGEINDVLNDVRNIISDDDSLQNSVIPALGEYNVAQFTTVDVPGHDHQSIISDASRIPAEEGEQERYLDPRSKTSFLFDHLSLEASDPQPVEFDTESEPFREALQQATLAYLASHYHDGVASVFSVPNSPMQFIIQIVANKYNPSNFWCGRWRSEYTVDLEASSLEGKILVNVHYYEQGNVQLATTQTLSTAIPPAVIAGPPNSGAVKIIALIGDEEGTYQMSLSDAYHEMGEKTFKGLRRALPLTRSKIDWDKVLGYRLGAELSAGKGVFGGS